MNSFRDFLQELSTNTGIKFNLIEDNGQEFYNGFDMKNSDTISLNLRLTDRVMKLYILKEYESNSSLLKYIIINKYNDIFKNGEQIITDILEGNETDKDRIEKALPFISNGCSLFIVNVDGDKKEALEIIRQLYVGCQVLSAIYKDNIIIIGLFNEIEEHARSIKDAIMSDLYRKCYISVGNPIGSYNDITRAYCEANESMVLGKKLNLKNSIFYYNKMLFERIVYNLGDNVKTELTYKFQDKFDKFDNDIILTIEQFANCGLNISDTAKKLYVHRNTLIYRLDKVKKDTGFDIRDFKDAMIFIIAFFVWKELQLS
ncbi:CdaR family transcriptional regulator [Clostridium sp. DJ247]|uniref:PucR family transcriptional regulator n=1 Tax=Clostridium sp. DJ247 TaxID=2726188 RepID=UPI0016244590|nr:helix-turn-helix domain-containing protein [Clostridium sp. DJ247]MBC2580904.1 PucR family transcriptional regulator [Clostridium sp. DJ247]